MSAEVRTLEETAAFFDVSLPTARAWVQRGCPVVERGGSGKAYQLDLRAVAAWLKTNREEEDQRREEKAERNQQLRLELLGPDMLEDTPGAKALTPAERDAWLRGEINRVRLAQLRVELVDAQLLKLDLAQAGSLLRDRLRALPDHLAQTTELGEDQVIAMLEAIDAALEDLADELKAVGSQDDLTAAA